MMQGHATTAGTDSFAQRHRRLRYRSLFEGGPRTSQAGFGCYRVNAGVPAHESALETALSEGVNLIDTSANYADGGSEQLVGNVLSRLVEDGRLAREGVVVVSKGGYLQGRNIALSQQRKAEGRPFPDTVAYAKGLEHCIHPVFLEDQLDRTLERLGLETLDGYLLHNPEYYLSWAAGQNHDSVKARAEYDRRIQLAFTHLEREVERGRIRCYGISSNTLPIPHDDPRFTCLERVLAIAAAVSPRHHFRLVQFPMNLFETGAVTEPNQPSGRTLLETAQEAGLGVLINRPLNAFADGGLVRLADVPATEPPAPETVDERLAALMNAERELVRDVLPAFDLSPSVRSQIEAQMAIGDPLKQNWRQLGSLETWEHLTAAQIIPRVEGVFQYLDQQHLPPAATRWQVAYREVLRAALDAVRAYWRGVASRRGERIAKAVRKRDADWSTGSPTLSQLAVRAIRSTRGVSCVLVGMRRTGYVADVVEELSTSVDSTDRADAWSGLAEELTALLRS